MTHADNLTRVQVLRGPDTPMQTVFYPWVAAIADHLEDVLTAHAPTKDGVGWVDDHYQGIDPACSCCGTFDEFGVPWPCATYASAVRLLDALDGGTP